MMFSKIRQFALCVGIIAVLTNASFAAFSITMHQANATVGNQPFTGIVGLEFDVVGRFDVLSLGVYDSGNDGIQGGKTLTTVLFDTTTRNILASATFDATDGSATSNYLWTDITPVSLTPGRYGLVSYGFDSDNLLHNKNIGGPGPTRDLRLDYVDSIWSTSTNVATASFSYGTTDYFDAPNMKYTPAPGVVLLGALGAALVGWMRRRQAL